MGLPSAAGRGAAEWPDAVASLRNQHSLQDQGAYFSLHYTPPCVLYLCINLSLYHIFSYFTLWRSKSWYYYHYSCSYQCTIAHTSRKTLTKHTNHTSHTNYTSHINHASHTNHTTESSDGAEDTGTAAERAPVEARRCSQTHS